MTGQDLPKITTPVPGPHSKQFTRRLASVESPNITHVGGAFPVFWHCARGANIEDVDGNVYIDLTSAFGVQGIGHSHPAVASAVGEQAAVLMHGMGDVHPSALKVALAERLRSLTPGDLSHVIFSSSGSEAVESALKTARMHTGKSGVIAFEGAYHGLTYGALAVTHRPDFRAPFDDQLGVFSFHAPFPSSDAADSVREVERILRTRRIGAVLIEPIQGRGGIRIPPTGFLTKLKELCGQYGALLIFDEIMTGFGRTGRWFAAEEEGVVPDLMVLGKGMTGGFPISACIGREAVMASWGPSTGEAIHTSTFLGSPLGARSALETIRILESDGLIGRSDRLGAVAMDRLESWPAHHPLVADVRGRGLMLGIELAYDGDAQKPAAREAAELVGGLMEDGLMTLLAGERHNVLAITPPFVITEEQLDYALSAMEKRLTLVESTCKTLNPAAVSV